MFSLISRIVNLSTPSHIVNLSKSYISEKIHSNTSKEQFSSDDVNKTNAVNRFISRFHPKVDVTIKSVKENDNKEMLEKFNRNAKGKIILQLYHCTENYKESYKTIFKDGFYIGQACNKGYGIYLASHSTYAYSWGGRNHVIVCDVIVDEEHVGKFFSEIYSTKNNWEYVVSKEELVYPRYLIEFDASNIEGKIKGWTNALCPTCPEYKHNFEECFRRCDCKQYPTADPEDIITIV